VTEVRPARPEELVLLPSLEVAADTVFGSMDIGPLPPPGTVEELTAALVILVIGDPPQGFARIDALGGGAHLDWGAPWCVRHASGPAKRTSPASL
jgi:hypothetical protein